MEFLDVVNDQDEVTGKASREDVHKNFLFHRIVHVLVFNKIGHLAVQKRGLNVDYKPGTWCSTAAGHAESGESYEQSAQRELLEEAGIEIPLEFFVKDFYSNPRNNAFLGVYKASYEGPFQPNPREVESIAFMSLDELNMKLKEGEPFHPQFEFILKKHFNLG